MPPVTRKQAFWWLAPGPARREGRAFMREVLGLEWAENAREICAAFDIERGLEHRDDRFCLREQLAAEVLGLVEPV